MGDPRFERLGIAVGVDRVGRGQDRGDRRLGRLPAGPACRLIGRAASPRARVAASSDAGQAVHQNLSMDVGQSNAQDQRSGPARAAGPAARQAVRARNDAVRASISPGDGDGKRDPRPAGDDVRGARRRTPARFQSPADADRARHGARPAVFRRQEPRVLDPPVDRLERLFLPSLAVRLRQFDGLDVAGPHAAADRHRLFADPADGVAVPAADQDEAAVDAGPVAGRGDARLDRFFGDRDVELCDLPQAHVQARSGVEYLGAILLNFSLLAAWAALYYGINYFLLLEEQIDQRERLEGQASSAQLAMLRYQLNPHFLFNTLNSISTLVLLKQTERANAMLARLSSFLRYTLANEPTAKVTLAQEVETLKLYLEIEKMRFEDRLRPAFPDRAGDDRRAAALAAAPAADRKRDQICGHPGRKRRRHLDHARRARARRCGSKSPTMATATGAEMAASPSTGVGLANIRDRLSQAYGASTSFRDQTERQGGL